VQVVGIHHIEWMIPQQDVGVGFDNSSWMVVVAVGTHEHTRMHMIVDDGAYYCADGIENDGVVQCRLPS